MHKMRVRWLAGWLAGGLAGLAESAALPRAGGQIESSVVTPNKNSAEASGPRACRTPGATPVPSSLPTFNSKLLGQEPSPYPSLPLASRVLLAPFRGTVVDFAGRL